MNRIVLTGRLGKDAELKYFGENKSVTTFVMAVDKNYKKEGDAPNWIPCKIWNRDKLSNYLTKGKAVSVDGELMIDKYEEDGVAKTFAHVKVDRLEFLSGGKEDKKNVTPDNFEYTPPEGFGEDYRAVEDDDIPF